MRGGVVGVVAAVCLGLAVEAQSAPATNTRPRTMAEDLQLLGQVVNQVRVNHADSLDVHKLMLAAVAGLLREADPHSFVVPALRLSAEAEALARDGKLTPVPVAFRFVDGVPVVAAVSAGNARAVGDVRVGDVLVAVDGAPVAADNAEELAAALAGPPKTSVVLALSRERADGTVVSLTRTVRRASTDDPAAATTVAALLPEATGYVRITTFVGEQIARDLQRALDSLDRAGMARLVLDLRDNGGGRVDEASLVAGAFLPAGRVVYTAEGRRADVADTGRVRRAFWRNAREVPVAVLINEGTASAAELVAGALQDHDRALIVGRPSFGKALLMRGFPLTDGSILMLVVGQVRTPCGRLIQRAFRGVRAAEYYRQAGSSTDTTGRPRCRTASGRTVYGGGGIVPDVRLPAVPRLPEWWSRLEEDGVLDRWAAATAGEAGTARGGAEAPSGAVLVEALGKFVERTGGTPPAPTGDEAAAFGQRLQILRAAYLGGEAAAIRAAAAGDAEVQAAAAALRTRP